MSGSFPLIYNNDSTNNMLFGMFDGSSIYGPYYQLFGNQYPNLSQRGGAEFVYDIRNNSDANFHIASFNGSSWTQKFLVNDIGTQVTGSLNVSGGITGSLFGTASYSDQALSASFATNAQTANTASYVLNAISASFASTASFVQNAQTASYVLNAISASFTTNAQTSSTSTVIDTTTGVGPYYITFTDGTTGARNLRVDSAALTFNATTNVLSTTASFATTASSVNTLNQNVLITGSLTVGATSLGGNENTLVIGPAPAGGTGEGGQIALQPAAGYTSGSFIDNYQDKFRVLRGTADSSNAEVASFNLQSRQFFLPAYNSSTAFTGTATAYLAVNSSGDVITSNPTAGSIGGIVSITQGASSTSYYVLNSILSGAAFASRAGRQIPMAAGTFKNLYLRLNTPQPAGGSLVVSLFVNAAATAISITIPAGSAAGVYSNTANTATIANGDLVCWEVINNAAATAATVQTISITYYA
jgi:hypothetical protein